MGAAPSDLENKFKAQGQFKDYKKVPEWQPKDLKTLLVSDKEYNVYDQVKKTTGSKQYTDMDFKANQESITQSLADMPKASSYEWKRAKDLFDYARLKVFQKNIEPNDIFQGALGDCYFLSALSVLAERPNLIERNFIQKEKNDQGLYAIYLCVDGQFQEVLVDDQFPSEKNKPVFSKSNEEDVEEFGDELWVLLMEKAYAKVFGCYQNIVAGATGNAIKDICGAPSMKQKTNVGENETWDFIAFHDDLGHMMSAGSGGQLVDGKEVDRGKGIVSGHAYAILDHKEVTSKQGKERIIQMRNPWGSKEWEGDWSDKSDKWTEELKKECNFVDADDGVFWIEIRDFVREFDDVCANLLQEDYLYTSQKINMTSSNKALIKFHVKYDHTHAHFQLTQYDERHFSQKGQYKYSLQKLLIAKADPLEYIDNKITTLRDLNIEKDDLKAGTYYAYVEVVWHKQNAGINSVVFSTYCSDLIQIDPNVQLLDDKEIQILDNVLVQIPPENVAKVKTYPGASDISRYTNTQLGYFYFVFDNKDSSKVLDETVKIVQPENLEPCYPNTSLEEFSITVKPGEKKMMKFKITSESGGDFYYKAGYAGGVQMDDNALIEEVKEKGAGDRKRRGNHEVYYYPYFYNKGYLLLHWNKEEKGVYEEELELKLNNLVLEGRESEKNPVLNFKLKPGEHILHKLNVVNTKDEFSFKTALWYELV